MTPTTWRLTRRGLALAVMAFACHPRTVSTAGTGALELRATTVPPGRTLTIKLTRWPTEAERAPLLAAISGPPAGAAGAERDAGARGGRGGAGRTGGPGGGRGRGGATATASPMARLAAAVKAAPTFGYVWSDGVTGYSIRYAWRSSEASPGRLVLVTDRRMEMPSAPPAAASVTEADTEFTVLEVHFDAKGLGEGKTSLTTKVVVDPTAGTLALEDYAAAPALLRINR